jgi:hypothetical protein
LVLKGEINGLYRSSRLIDGLILSLLLLNACGPTAATQPPQPTKIVYVSNVADIFIMNSDGSGQTQLTTEPKIDAYPALSADGKKIAFASNRDGDFVQIYIMNADGSNQTRLTKNAFGTVTRLLVQTVSRSFLSPIVTM